jgi:hypothetical protein
MLRGLFRTFITRLRSQQVELAKDLRHAHRASHIRVGHANQIGKTRVFAKGDKINLTPAERNELRAILADIVTVYRQGARR